MKLPFRKKETPKKLNCYECDGETVLTEITEKNIEYIIENLDLSGFPKIIFKLKKLDKEKFLITMINKGYNYYKCNKCKAFRLEKK